MQSPLSEFYIGNKNIIKKLSSIDLQLHTFYSDGTIAPYELVKQASLKRFSLISITDHNSIDCYTNEFLNYCNMLKVNILPGVEIDCGSGLDILIYDIEKNKISEEFKKFLTPILKEINILQSNQMKKCLKDITFYLKNKKNKFPWINWRENKNKEFLISNLNIDNIRKINLKTGRFDLPKRSYIGKPHLVKLLLSVGLINWNIFIKYEKIKDFNKKEKILTKILFTRITKWESDNKLNTKIINYLTKSSYISILAHPGKSFNDKNFRNFIYKMIIDFRIKGAECDYRAYHDKLLDYNKITYRVLKNLNKRRGLILYATGGSDSHHGF
jgi:hypothetical protein